MFTDYLKRCAYDNISVDDHVVDADGWIDGENFLRVFENCIKDVECPVIIEVGTWKGLSALAMANKCKELGKNFLIICIDTWLGAPEFWTTGLNDGQRNLNPVNGYPTVFYTFTKNVKKFGFENNIVPFPISSIQGADVLRHYDITADVIYIDAAHEYAPVKADIEAYLKLLKPSGTIIGDDYDWPGVKRAVNELCPQCPKEGRVWYTSQRQGQPEASP